MWKREEPLRPGVPANTAQTPSHPSVVPDGVDAGRSLDPTLGHVRSSLRHVRSPPFPPSPPFRARPSQRSCPSYFRSRPPSWWIWARGSARTSRSWGSGSAARATWRIFLAGELMRVLRPGGARYSGSSAPAGRTICATPNTSTRTRRRFSLSSSAGRWRRLHPGAPAPSSRLSSPCPSASRRDRPARGTPWARRRRGAGRP